MASVIVTIKIMPESPEIDLTALKDSAMELIGKVYGETEARTEEEPIAFGLKALRLTFVFDESKGSPDILEDQLRNLDGVQSVETVDVRRAIG